MTLKSNTQKDEEAFEAIVKSDFSATMFLKKQCWENYRRYCIRCHSYQLYRLANKKYRCKNCGYTFHDFSGRWLNNCKITPRQWLNLVKLFEGEMSARRVSEKLAVSYPTTLKAFQVLRFSIIAQSPDSALWLNRLYPNTRSRALMIFGIREIDPRVKIDWLENISFSTIFSLSPRFLRQSAIYFTTSYNNYKFIIFHDHHIFNSQPLAIKDSAAHPPEPASEFWRYLKFNILKHRGISREKFPLYLKELEFRYNHRHRSIFDDLCRFIADIIPRTEETDKHF